MVALSSRMRVRKGPIASRRLEKKGGGVGVGYLWCFSGDEASSSVQQINQPDSAEPNLDLRETRVSTVLTILPDVLTPCTKLTAAEFAGAARVKRFIERMRGDAAFREIVAFGAAVKRSPATDWRSIARRSARSGTKSSSSDTPRTYRFPRHWSRIRSSAGSSTIGSGHGTLPVGPSAWHTTSGASGRSPAAIVS